MFITNKPLFLDYYNRRAHFKKKKKTFNQMYNNVHTTKKNF